jgi:hypothetical protein
MFYDHTIVNLGWWTFRHVHIDQGQMAVKIMFGFIVEPQL